jgi:hypothetical protein
MKSPKLLCGVFAMVCAMLMAPPVLYGDDGNGRGVCRLDGAWLGSSPAWEGTWTIFYDSDSYWTGPLVMRFIGSDPTLGGFFPATSLSSTTGTWIRTGRRTFEYTMIHYGLAEGGQQPVFIAKLCGSVVLNSTCDEMEATNGSIALYDPTQDPFGEDPPFFDCIPDGSLSTARRIPVQPPCEPPP